MLEDRVSFGAKFLRAQGHRHLDVFDFPFRPSTAIHPYPTVFQPFGFVLFFDVDCRQDSVGTYLMRAVRVGQIARDKYLMRLDCSYQLQDDLDVGFADGVFDNLSCFIEGQVEEMNPMERNLVVCACCTRFSATDQAFDRQYVAGVESRFFFLRYELARGGEVFRPWK